MDDAGPRFERVLIDAALRHSGGLRHEAARLLGWGRNTLTRKLARSSEPPPGVSLVQCRVGATGRSMHAPPGLCGYASDQPDRGYRNGYIRPTRHE